jgi:hypothetical protein
MVENKMRATTVIIATILLIGGLFAAASINRCSASIVSHSATTLETLAADGETIITVVINEVMADNEATIQSPHGDYSDWIELYNYGDYSIDLSGIYLTDNLANPTWQFPTGTTIIPNSYLVVWADGYSEIGALHADFRLNANGETIGLLASDGWTVIDSLTLGKQIEDVSYGRLPDGSSSWSYLTTPTAGRANVAGTRSITSTPWPIWILIILGLVACIGVLLKDKIRAKRKQ